MNEDLEKKIKYVKQKYYEGKLEVFKLRGLDDTKLDIAVVGVRVSYIDDDGFREFDYHFVDYIYGGEYYSNEDEWKAIEDMMRSNSKLYEKLLELGV